MLTLVGGGPSRWVKPYWLLKELGLDFEEKIGFADQEFLLKVNPHKKVPVLIDDDFVLTESTAIVNYLATKYGGSEELIPKPGTIERARYDEMISLATTELEQPLWRILKHQRLYAESDRSAADVELAKRDFKRTAAILEKQLGDYAVGNRFTAADIVMAYTLNWANWWNLLEGFPKLQAYSERHIKRKAFPSHLYEHLPV